MYWRDTCHVVNWWRNTCDFYFDKHTRAYVPNKPKSLLIPFPFFSLYSTFVALLIIWSPCHVFSLHFFFFFYVFNIYKVHHKRYRCESDPCQERLKRLKETPYAPSPTIAVDSSIEYTIQLIFEASKSLDF